MASDRAAYLENTGIEHRRDKRETLIGEKGDMSRINFMARYNLN